MILDRIEIRDFRNIRLAALNLEAPITVLEGPNGAGKTAVLEAIHLVARGKSFRTGGSAALVRAGSEGFGITVTGHSRGGRRLELRARKREGGRLSLSCDGNSMRKVSTAARLMPLQLILPGVSDLVFGPPAGRREWLDWGAFHLLPAYLDQLQRFRRILRQRNASIRGSSASEQNLWTARLADAGQELTRLRASYVQRLMPHFAKARELFIPELKVDLELAPGHARENLVETLALDRGKDIELGTTRHGPHRADVAVLVAFSGSLDNARLASGVLSRGQGKALAMTMKFAQASLLAATGSPPAFLLDEALAELDSVYGARLLEGLGRSPFRTVLTTTSADAVQERLGAASSRAVRLFRMLRGAVEAER